MPCAVPRRGSVCRCMCEAARGLLLCHLLSLPTHFHVSMGKPKACSYCSTQVPHGDVLHTKPFAGNREKFRAGVTPVLLISLSVSRFTRLFPEKHV